MQPKEEGKMSHTRWFGNMLQGVQYRGMAPPNAEETLRQVEGAEDVIRRLSSLGARNAFTQEELAVYRKLESEGHSLRGKSLTLAAKDSGLSEDPRIEIDKLTTETTTQRATLDRLQKRGENLSAGIAQYAVLTSEALGTAAELQREADNLEASLNEQRDATHESLLSIENMTLDSATEITTAEHQPQHCLLSSANVNVFEQMLGDLSLWSLNQVESSKELLSESSNEVSDFYLLQEELSRLHDAHAISRLGVAVADSELVSAQAELDFLNKISQEGNPSAELPPSDLRNLIEAEQSNSNTMKDDIKLKLRTLFKTVQTQWDNPCTNWVISGIDVEENRLREQLKIIEDTLYYQRQWWSAQIIAKHWIGKEQLATENVEVGVANFIESMRATLSLSEILQQSGDDVAAHSIHEDAERNGIESVVDLLSFVQLDIDDLQTALNRCQHDDVHTTSSLIDAHSELRSCLHSKRDTTGNQSGIDSDMLSNSIPQTYFEEDLVCLKNDINDASEKLLGIIEIIEKDKRVFDTEWVSQVKPNQFSVKSSSNVGNIIPTNVAVTEEPHFVQLSEPTPPIRETNAEFESHEQAAEMSTYRKESYNNSSHRLDKILDSSPGSDDGTIHPRKSSPPRKLDYSPIRSKTEYSESSPVSSREEPAAVTKSNTTTTGYSITSRTTASYRPVSVKRDPPKEPSSASSPAPVRKARTPAFLLRPDGTRMTAEEYRHQNMRLMQKLGKS